MVKGMLVSPTAYICPSEFGDVVGKAAAGHSRYACMEGSVIAKGKEEAPSVERGFTVLLGGTLRRVGGREKPVAVC
jgi:hypothetical protein